MGLAALTAVPAPTCERGPAGRVAGEHGQRPSPPSAPGAVSLARVALAALDQCLDAVSKGHRPGRRRGTSGRGRRRGEAGGRRNRQPGLSAEGK